MQTYAAYAEWGGIMRRRRKNGRRLALVILILIVAAGLGLLTIRFQRIFMEYAVNVCEDSAIKEINTLMEDEVFSHPDEFAELVVLERDSDNRITALRTDIIAVGMGPRVKVGLAGLAQMEAQFVSAFTSAGINQTRHRILIEVHAGFRILTPFGGEDREIVSTYPVTDTVIVGTVPERYTYIGGSGSDLLGEIRDYEENSDISHEIGK